MESVCVSGFLLLLFSTGVHLSPHPELKIEHERGDAILYPWFFSVDDYVLYKVGGDGDLLLLMNCSQPERPQPHGYQVMCVNDSTGFYFNMSKLTMSHSGDYRAVGWRGGNITEHKSFRLIVCAEHHLTSLRLMNIGDRAELCRLNSPLGHGSSLQLYRYDRRIRNIFLVLDTNSSLEPLVEDLKGRLQVDLNTSLITLTGVTMHDFNFYCTVWRGAQCQRYNIRNLEIATTVFAHEEENVTLPCIAKEELPNQVYWFPLTGHGQFFINQTHTQEVMYNKILPREMMYMLNGSQTGDYSLIIPSVSLQHSGWYECGRGDFWDTGVSLNDTLLFICTKASSYDVMFSPGESLHLNLTEHMKNFRIFWGIQFYRQKTLQAQVLIVDFLDNLDSNSFNDKDSVFLSEDLRGRMTVSTSPSNSFLTISNLTVEDSGLYTWRVYGRYNYTLYLCYEGSFRLVYLDPLGVHSPFYRAYAPLIGCGLLGLVTAVIWFKLRSRRGEQTSGHQSREGPQSGDEDLYEELEMAELNTPPSAVSDGAVEHSI